MPGSGTGAEYDMTDTVNLRLRSEGFEIFRVRAEISHIGCEKADEKSLLVFGEYSIFIILRATGKSHDYCIKCIRCPFVTSIPISGKLPVFSEGQGLRVSLSGPPMCRVEDLAVKQDGRNTLCRIALSCRISLCEPEENRDDAVSNKPGTAESVGADSCDSGSVRVWRVDSSKKYTVEELLNMDRDSLARMSGPNGREEY